MRLVSVFSPTTEEEVLAIVALLEAREVPCFVQGTSARSASPGMEVRARPPRTVMVPADRSAEAVELISQVRTSCGAHHAVARLRRSSKLRSLIDFIVFGSFRAIRARTLEFYGSTYRKAR